MLENARKRLRALVKLIDKQKRKPSTRTSRRARDEAPVDLPGFAAPDSFERFRPSACVSEGARDSRGRPQARMNVALTRSDLDDLEAMLAASGLGVRGSPEGKAESQGSGCSCARSWARPRGREAILRRLSGGKDADANQIEFVNMVVDHLTEHGVMDKSLLYESPFTDRTPRVRCSLRIGPGR